MFSPTPPPTDSEDSGILPVSHTNGITDSDISILCRFLFRSTNDKGGLPLKLDVEDTSRLAHAPRHGVAGLNLSRQVLDALVAICVCTSSQRLALSVSLGSKHVQITIAENDTKPSPIIRTHLTSIWEQLGALATLKKRLRRGNNFPDHGTSLRPAGAHLPVSHSEIGALEELKWALERDIHKHCYLKTKQRMTKYLSAYNVFYKFYTRNRKVLDPTAVIADLAFNLSYLYKMVMEYKGLTYLSGIPVELEWDELAMHCRLILHFYTEDEMNVQMKIWGVIDAWRSTEVVKGALSISPTCHYLLPRIYFLTLPRQPQAARIGPCKGHQKDGLLTPPYSETRELRLLSPTALNSRETCCNYHTQSHRREAPGALLFRCLPHCHKSLPQHQVRQKPPH